MGETYIWSDPHLGHFEVIGYEGRPFSSTKEMDKTLLANWRKTVTKHDKIITLGDFALHYSKEMLKEVLRNLAGYKILVLGNHDRGHSLTWWRDVGFDEVYPYPVIVDGFYILSHEPCYVGKESPYANIHGHTHATSTDNPYAKNVCVEKINYTPVLLKTVQAEIVTNVEAMTGVAPFKRN